MLIYREQESLLPKRVECDLPDGGICDLESMEHLIVSLDPDGGKRSSPAE